MSRIAIALGGNALGDNAQEQLIKVQATAKVICELAIDNHGILIGHGNGPQVGAIFNAFAKANTLDPKIPVMPFAECGAMSQGYIGYHLKQAIVNELMSHGLQREVLYFITQTIVDKNDPAFTNPTKPVGAFYPTLKEAVDNNAPGSTIIEVPGKGYRRVVPSPKPINLMSMNSVKQALDDQKIVIAGGGGGIPTIVKDGKYIGVDGVIDKDYVVALMARNVNADILVILTNVPNVFVNYGKETQKKLEKVTCDELQVYIDTDQFGKGSMLPKVQAAIEFVKNGIHRKAIIAQLEDLPKAIKGEAGTIITR